MLALIFNTTSMLISIVLGTVTVIAVDIYLPDMIVWLLGLAKEILGFVPAELGQIETPSAMESILDERLLVLLAFIIASRLIVSFLATAFASVGRS